MKLIRKISSSAFLLLVLLLAINVPITSLAQETSGALTGRVIGEKQQPINGATVEAIHTPSGTKYMLSTDNDGRYTLTHS